LPDIETAVVQCRKADASQYNGTMASQPQPFITPEEYLAMERTAEFRSEYRSGLMVMMAGNTKEHVRIVGDLMILLGNGLQGRPCEPWSNELRVKVSETAYVYPDVIVTCGEPMFTDCQMDTLTNPLVIVEVLSKTTSDYDRGEKFVNYRRIESLQQYVLISQDKPLVEIYTRQTNRHWDLAEIEGLESILDLTSIDCGLSLSEIYRRVEFPPSLQIVDQRSS
jgi:Uma2 family endonuclease